MGDLVGVQGMNVETKRHFFFFFFQVVVVVVVVYMMRGMYV